MNLLIYEVLLKSKYFKTNLKEEKKLCKILRGLSYELEHHFLDFFFLYTTRIGYSK